MGSLIVILAVANATVSQSLFSYLGRIQRQQRSGWRLEN